MRCAPFLHDIYAVNHMTKTTEVTETHDLNIATFIKEVKEVPTEGHVVRGGKVYIQFALSAAEFAEHQNDYWNSVHARCDSTRKNFLQLTKRSPRR